MNRLLSRGLKIATGIAEDLLRSALRSSSTQRSRSRRSRSTRPRPRTRTHPRTSKRTSISSRRDAPIGEYDTSRGLPRFTYAPEPDGEADPGEVVWTWVPYEEDASQGKDRPVLVLARDGGDLIVAQLTSKDHDRDAEQEAHWGRYWMDIGTGAWDRRGRPSEVRLDRLLWVEPSAIRREGGRLAEDRFREVTAALRDMHGA
ncbi:MAG: type II toxin-antitoxin system PemK/MazF family toxin [Bowdeniella nasicola]|nr:type II toxin-antitoxin system PemK/MazF family toxin [Bowdeniella nasicola]